MSKFGLALIAITAISVVMATHAYYIQAADAQAKLPNNSVRSETIVDGQVKTQDIGDGTIQEQDIADDVIPPAGGTGHLVVTQRSEVHNIDPNTNIANSVSCNSDEQVTAGGYGGFTLGDNVILQGSQISVSGGVQGNAWFTGLHYVSGDGPRDITFYAVCAKIVP